MTIYLTVVAFVLLFIIEKYYPLRRTKANLLARLIVNFALAILTFFVAMFIVMPAAMEALHWESTEKMGVLHIISTPGWMEFVLSFLLLDLAFYYWHLANHKIPFLWRFHNVHHIDPDLDVSTAFRFHFGEVFFSTLFRVLQVVIIGVSFKAFVIYEGVFQLNTLFHHSNIRLPIHLERLLNKIIVTPRMHGIHHSQIAQETNSNYSVVFSFWDKLHRTIGLNIPQSEITIGIPGYSSPGDNDLTEALTMPFKKQREYWKKADGSLPKRTEKAHANKSFLEE